ncbi:MAG TPA: alpha/beta fold hydrolase [Aliidongia sp.]|nr:alpha/beta fold hydrolase [Aliidongia sp.]
MARWMAALLLALVLAPGARAADGPPQSEGDVEVRDFAFQDGERLPVLKLHYTALGTPRRDAAGRIVNAVLLLHGTTGTGKGFLAPSLADALFRPGQPLDAGRFYIVLPDGIGAGGSTKPSDGLRGHFPHYGYVDQVEAQQRMLAGMGIDHLRLVSGISQGGMQTWLWGERFPDAMDALAPVASMPGEISGRNLMWRQIIIRAIRNDPDWHDGNYDPAHPPTQWMETAAPLFALMVGNPERLQLDGSDRAKTLAYIDQLIHAYQSRDADDYLYDFESSRDYDPAPGIGRIKAPMLAINFADDEVNPAGLAVTRETIAKIPSAKLVLLPVEGTGYGHASIFQAALWAPALKGLLDTLP